MYQSGSYPNYAFGGSPAGGAFHGEYYTISRLAGQAPSGQDAIRFTAIPTTDVVEDIGGADWHRGADWPAFSQGDSVFIRWRVRFHAGMVWKRAQDEGRGHWKSSIFGDTCESAPYQPTRMISFDRRGGEDPVDEAAIFAVQNIGCATVDCTTSPRPIHVLGSWTNIQIEYQSGSTATSMDAVIRIWINNNNYGSPTGITPDGFQLKVSGWSVPNGCGSSGIRWGPGTFEPINEDGELVVDWADYQIGTTFDPNWA